MLVHSLAIHAADLIGDNPGPVDFCVDYIHEDQLFSIAVHNPHHFPADDRRIFTLHPEEGWRELMDKIQLCVQEMRPQ